MKLVMAGCHEAGYEIVSALLEQGVRFDWFVTITPEKAEQQQVSGYRSFEDLALQYGIPVYYAKKYSLKDPEDLAFFQEQQFDILVQGGWQRLFPDEVLDSLRIGAIGVHGSPDFLPKGRGRSPLNWSLIQGQERFILHYFLMKPGADDGDVFHYEMFDINAWDDIRTLYYKNALITIRVLKNWLPKLAMGQYQLYEQKGEPTYYPKRSPEDGRINWNQTVEQVYNFIRAQTHPYPGAFTFCGDQEVRVWKAQPFDSRIDDPAWENGQIIARFSEGHLVLKCAGGLLLITEYETAVELKVGDRLN